MTYGGGPENGKVSIRCSGKEKLKGAGYARAERRGTNAITEGSTGLNRAQQLSSAAFPAAEPCRAQPDSAHTDAHRALPFLCKPYFGP